MQQAVPDLDRSGAVLLPVGHCLGAFPEPASGTWTQRVRVGTEVIRLAELPFAVWALAHGDPDRPPGRRWGPDAVLTAAEGLLGTDVAGLVPTLADDRLLAEVVPGTPEALAFAQAHQLKPLMLGLGNLADDPGTYEIGLPGQPVAQVNEVFYRLYEWGHLEPDLWTACRATAAASDGEFADPHILLDAILEAVHGLLSPNAAYLDVI